MGDLPDGEFVRVGVGCTADVDAVGEELRKDFAFVVES